MKKTIHLIGGIVATFCIAVFFSSTLIAELVRSHDTIATVKGLIVMPGLFILIPAMVAVGASGFALAGGRKGRLLRAKKNRMPFIGANGLLLLVPAAILLDHWASAGTFDTTFYLVQGVELLAGAINLGLMVLNIRDGLRLAGGRRSNGQPVVAKGG